MMNWLCSRSYTKSNADIVTGMTSSTSTRYVLVTPLQNTSTGTERRLSFLCWKLRLLFLGLPSSSASVMTCSSPSSSSSVEFIYDYHDLSVSAPYSSSTEDYSQRRDVYVRYPRASPKSISTFSAITPTQSISHDTQSLSSSLYSSSTGDNSQRKDWFVSYARLSPKSTSNLSSFSATRGRSRCTRTLSGVSHPLSPRNLSIMAPTARVKYVPL